jgi:hypothetical protein
MAGYLAERGPPPLVQLTPFGQARHHALTQRLRVGHHY